MTQISKKTSIILVITALLLSRAIFVFIDDPEGPNLLVVIVMAAVVYFLSWMALRFNNSITGLKRLLFGISAQIVIVAILTLILR